MAKEALMILTGITADASKKAHVLDYFRGNTEYEVFLPRLCQFCGIDWSARQLAWFLERHQIGRYSRCHFVCYISGGFILRQALSVKPIANVGRVVYLRSPFQEAVPERVIEQLGSIAAAFSNGKMLFDLASRDKDRLPVIGAEEGVILEKGVSAMAAQLGIRADQFEVYRHREAFCLPPAKAVFCTELSHDDVYTSDALLARIAAFLESGSFAGATAIDAWKESS
ncbi:hypothetical protein [Methylomicrobium lacus]|uniref:hypothetical protein n=1 Tax=Methylomicrobium lacus TaxID=136992 RepID=UPI0035A89DBF